MAPAPKNGECLITDMFPKSTSSALNMFLHSPIAVSGGQVLTAVSSATAPSGATVNGGITGTVVGLLDSSYAPVQNLATTAAGYAIVTIDKNQRYVMRVSTTAYAVTDASKTFRLTATEPATLSTATATNDSYSERQLDGAQEQAAGTEQITVGGLVKPPAVTGVNDAGVAGTEVYCQITSAFHFSVA